MTSNASDAETVPQGHNILRFGFALAHNDETNNTRLMFRSGGNGKHNSFLATTDATNSVWEQPQRITLSSTKEVQKETFAYVVTKNPGVDDAGQDQFLFNFHQNRVHMRTRLSGALNWGTSVRIAALNKVELTHRTICGIWIGGPTQTINLYCWSQPNQLTECVGNRNDAGQYEWSSEELPQQSPPIEQPGESANRKLAVVNTANGVYLLSMDAGLNICWRHKDVYGVWEDEAVIVQAANVEEHSPMAIIAVAAENAVVDANLTPADGSPVTIHCYPEAPDGREPLTPFGPDRAAGFAIAYVDKNYTSHVLRIDHDGRVITNQALCQIEPERISRLRTLPGNEQRVIPTLYMTPGAYPRSVNLFAISSLHVTKTVISFSQIVPLALVKDLAAKRAAFYQAHHHLGLALGDRDVLAKKLIATHKTVREDFDNVTHVGNVGARDYYELRFLLSRALWERAFLAARVAQNAAIAAYNAMLKADRLIELNTIKTEARVMEAGVAIFPPLADGTILPVE